MRGIEKVSFRQYYDLVFRARNARLGSACLQLDFFDWIKAGIAFNNSSVTLVHGMSRPIGALFHIPHGMSNAILLNVCLTYAADGTYERFGNLGRIIGAADDNASDKEAAEAFLQSVRNLCAVCEIPTLEKYGVDKTEFFEQIDKMAEDAVSSGSPSNTIKYTDKKILTELYKSLW